jgi:PTS system nitrogen regulatory IIA component
MKLGDFVVTEAIIPNLTSTDRNGVIEEMIDALVSAGTVAPELRDEMIKEVIKREKKGSTGFGKGVAVPHVKHEKVKNITACIGVSHEGIDFNALDKEPVYSVFMIFSPMDRPDEHLQAMENIFAHLQKDTFRRFLRQARTVEAVTDLIHEADSQHFQV